MYENNKTIAYFLSLFMYWNELPMDVMSSESTCLPSWMRASFFTLVRTLGYVSSRLFWEGRVMEKQGSVDGLGSSAAFRK